MAKTWKPSVQHNRASLGHLGVDVIFGAYRNYGPETLSPLHAGDPSVLTMIHGGSIERVEHMKGAGEERPRTTSTRNKRAAYLSKKKW